MLVMQLIYPMVASKKALQSSSGKTEKPHNSEEEKTASGNVGTATGLYRLSGYFL